MNALNNTALLQFRFRHAANAVRTEIGVARLNATQTAQILVARLLPFGNQIRVGDLLAYAVLVQFATDGLTPIEQIVDVPGLLVMDFEDGPQ